MAIELTNRTDNGFSISIPLKYGFSRETHLRVLGKSGLDDKDGRTNNFLNEIINKVVANRNISKEQITTLMKNGGCDLLMISTDISKSNFYSDFEECAMSVYRSRRW